jgi:hypothetical protein
MSWDVFCMHLPPGMKSMADMPEEFRPPPIGPRAEIVAKICAAFPECDFSDPSWGRLDAPGCIVEISPGDEEIVDVVCLHVRGDSRAPAVVVKILDALGLRAIDPSSESGVFEHAPALQSQSFERWRAYRDKVVGSFTASASDEPQSE